MQPGAARNSQEPPAARSSQEKPGAAIISQHETVEPSGKAICEGVTNSVPRLCQSAKLSPTLTPNPAKVRNILQFCPQTHKFAKQSTILAPRTRSPGDPGKPRRPTTRPQRDHNEATLRPQTPTGRQKPENRPQQGHIYGVAIVLLAGTYENLSIYRGSAGLAL